MKYFLLKDDAEQYHILAENAMDMGFIPLIVAHGSKEQMQILKESKEKQSD